MNNKILFLTFLILLSGSVLAQEEHNHHLGDEHDHDAHVHHNNEISVAIGVVPLPEENEITAGIHLHYIRSLGKKKKFGIGLGLEYIIDEHQHFTTSTVFQYRIVKGWTLAYAPGMMVFFEPDDVDIYLAHHIETAYEFELGNWHLGPVFEVGIEPIGIHYMGGVHLGIGF